MMAVTPSNSAHCRNQNSKLSKKGKKSLPYQSESMNQVTYDSDDSALGISDIEFDADSIPRLETVYNSEEEVDSVDDKMAKDWFSDVGNDWETLYCMGHATDELSGVDSEGSSFVDIDLESVGEQSEDPGMDQDPPFVSIIALEEIVAAISGGPSDICMELYNSGTTCHISLYHNMFETFTQTPKSLNAANKGKFIAIG